MELTISIQQLRGKIESLERDKKTISNESTELVAKLMNTQNDYLKRPIQMLVEENNLLKSEIYKVD